MCHLLITMFLCVIMVCYDAHVTFKWSNALMCNLFITKFSCIIMVYYDAHVGVKMIF